MAKHAAPTLSQYVVLPTRGLHADSPTSSPSLGSFLRQFERVQTFAGGKSFGTGWNMSINSNFRVLDSISENGAKLVEMTNATANEILAHQPGLRIVPVVYYYPA